MIGLYLFAMHKKPREFIMRLIKCCAALVLVALCAAPAFAAPIANPAVKLETSMGDIILRLDATKAPISVENFVNYVKAGHYDGTIFHRVIPNFMVQGGGMTPDMKEKASGKPIKNEAANGLKNQKYTVAMARTSDPNSATAQFFINTQDNPFLDYKSPTPQGWGYAVFGKVLKGQEIVDKIKAVATGKRGMHDDVPREAVIIKKATIIE